MKLSLVAISVYIYIYIYIYIGPGVVAKVMGAKVRQNMRTWSYQIGC